VLTSEEDEVETDRDEGLPEVKVKIPEFNDT